MQTDWDLRMACLLLYAFDKPDNFWQLYGDFLPSADECTSLLLATEVIISYYLPFPLIFQLFFYLDEFLISFNSLSDEIF